MKKPLCIMLILLALTSLVQGCSARTLNFGPSSVSLGKAGASRTAGTAANNSTNTAADTSTSAFAFDIFRELNREDSQKSVFISPYSISAALTMAYEGAGTSTREAMAKALGYTGMTDAALNENNKKLLKHLRQLDKKVELDIGNSIWIRKGVPIKDQFLKTNKDVFTASVTPLDFSASGAADKINGWIASATKNKIKKMVDSPIPTDVVMYLINAVYFKGDWTDRFDSGKTFSTSFTKGAGGTRDVMMMRRKGTIEYGQGRGYKAVRLPYGSGKAAMYCILPEGGTSVNDFITSLNCDKWNAIKDSISAKNDVTLQLPRFKLEYGIKDLKQSLSSLGMGIAFTEGADFSGIRDNVLISRVLHKAVIEVNEKGSEAAAATGVEIQLTALAQPLSFIADRPFVFIIADDETGTMLFMGKLYD